MSIKAYKDIAVGQEFSHMGKQYIKIVPEKISCCKALGAHEVENPNSKIVISPNTQVEIKDDESE